MPKTIMRPEGFVAEEMATEIKYLYIVVIILMQILDIGNEQFKILERLSLAAITPLLITIIFSQYMG